MMNSLILNYKNQLGYSSLIGHSSNDQLGSMEQLTLRIRVRYILKLNVWPLNISLFKLTKNWSEFSFFDWLNLYSALKSENLI